MTATNNFSEERLIGVSSYARDYRGFLPDRTQIAIKKYIKLIDGEHSWQQSWQESRQSVSGHPVLEVIEGIRHQNINQVFGYCIKDNQLLLVSEYVDNGSLELLIQDLKKRESVFNWHLRVAVCTGIARGLSYLHEDANPHVIHHDIKSANILLDTNFTPKITGFDIAQLFCNPDELPLEADDDRYIATQPCNLTSIAGSFGYIDPACLQTNYVLTEKTDVYCFGVVMLEIVCGRMSLWHGPGSDVESMIEWVSELVENGRTLEIIDPVLRDYPTDDVLRFIDVAFLCIQEDPQLRPSMNDVIQMLDGVCNSRRLLRTPDMSTTDDTSYTAYLSPVSSFRSSIADTHFEVEGESSVLEGEHNVNSTEIESAAQEQNNGSTYSVQPSVIILSGTGDLVERLSQSTVFKTHPRQDFPEAVYPPFRTRMFNGSRSLYTS